jgi:hypothetical protein
MPASVEDEVPLIRRDNRATFSPFIWEKGILGSMGSGGPKVKGDVLSAVLAGSYGTLRSPSSGAPSRATFSRSIGAKVSGIEGVGGA